VAKLDQLSIKMRGEITKRDQTLAKLRRGPSPAPNSTASSNESQSDSRLRLAA
jgi:hypothetical protein